MSWSFFFFCFCFPGRLGLVGIGWWALRAPVGFRGGWRSGTPPTHPGVRRGEGTGEGVREVGAGRRGPGAGPEDGSCSLLAAVGLEDALTWGEGCCLAVPTPQRRLPGPGGQACTAGVFFTPTALCAPAGRFYKHPLGSLGIKGIRVIKSIFKASTAASKKSLRFEGRDVAPFLLP